ncbi:hypothetical protein BJ546DRAFT_449370 [Cryomyces antarcticus]
MFCFLLHLLHHLLTLLPPSSGPPRLELSVLCSDQKLLSSGPLSSIPSLCAMAPSQPTYDPLLDSLRQVGASVVREDVHGTDCLVETHRLRKHLTDHVFIGGHRRWRSQPWCREIEWHLFRKIPRENCLADLDMNV